MMDASILLPPTGTPLTGIDFVKRLPCGDVEKTRRVSEHWTQGREEGVSGWVESPPPAQPATRRNSPKPAAVCQGRD